MRSTCPKHCRACGVRMTTRRKNKLWRPDDHCARGLCHEDYTRLARTDGLTDYERTTWSAEELVGEWEILQGQGNSLKKAASLLGMSPHRIKQAIRRTERRRLGLSTPKRVPPSYGGYAVLYRRYLIQRDRHGLTVREAAGKFGVPYSTLKGAIAHQRMKLRAAGKTAA